MILKRLSTDYVRLNPHECIACWKCIEACPKQVIGKVEFLWHRHARIADAGVCIGCNKCVRNCPNGCFTSTR